jgi:uncharacterized membrane protein (DUF2068 family)
MAARAERGLRLIIVYKVVRGAAALAVAAVMLGCLLSGKAEFLSGVGPRLAHHFAGAWSVSLAKALISATKPGHLWLAALALAMDGAVTLLEGWALHHGHWWGPWLVVVTMSSLLPFELVAIARRFSPWRIAILACNVAIVAYLLRKALSERHRPHPQATLAP